MSKTALITGASSGIGLEFTRIFAREKYNLIITARREQELITLKKELESRYGISVEVFAADLSKENTPEELYSFCSRNGNTIDVLVNNAGIGDYGFFHTSDWEKTATMIDLNIKSLTHLTRLFLPGFIDKKKAYILNVASTAAFQPGPLMSVYYATKHYVLAFGEAISNELNGTGVVVSTLCPGPTDSEFQSTANMQKSKLFKLFPVADSKAVAEYGYKSMIREKRVAVYGFMNKIGRFSTRLLPGSLLTSVVRFIQESGGDK